MKCRICGKDIPENSKACPECGADVGSDGIKLSAGISFPDQQDGNEQQGIIGSLPPQSAKAAEAPAPGRKVKKELPKEQPSAKQAEAAPARPEQQADKKETDLADVVKNFGRKVGSTARKIGTKAADATKAAAAKVSDAAGDAAEKAGDKNALKIILITAAAVVVLVLAVFGIMAIPGGDNGKVPYKLGAVVDEELYILNGQKLSPLYDDLSDDIDYQDLSSMLATIDFKSYYLITDVERDEATYYQTGDLILIGKNGKYQDIDEDVIVGSLQTAGKVLWYARLDKDEVILCSCVGTKVTEVGEDIDYSRNYFCSTDAKLAYFNVVDKEASVACFAQGGKVEELADNAQIVGVSVDYKKLFWLDEDSDLYLYDGKKDQRIAKSVGSVVYDPKTMDCLVVDEDGELSFIAYGKKPVDIDDEVENILVFGDGYSYFAYYDSADITASGYAYYNKDGDLYRSDLKGKNPERIIKNFYDDVYSAWEFVDDTAIYWADDDEINRYLFKNGKTDSYKIDAEDLGYANLSYYDGIFLFISVDDELFAAKFGDKKPRLINDDAEEIQLFTHSNGKVYYVDDGDLYISPLKEDAGERLVKDFFDFYPAHDGTLYVLADMDEDGGDLYIIQNGKAKEISSDVQYTFPIY